MTKRIHSPIWQFGGKGVLVSKIIPLIPEHHIFVEVFGGGASLLLGKRQSNVEVYNDINSNLVNFFRVLRDPIKFKRFYRRIICMPVSREEYNNCRDNWEKQDNDIDKAVMWYMVARQSFAGKFNGGWAYTIKHCNSKITASCFNWMSILEKLPDIHSRLLKVQIENLDFRELIKKYDTSNTFFYMDPPYIKETRRSGELEFEISENDHRELIDILLETKGKIFLSGYEHPIYEPLLKNSWKIRKWSTTCWSAGRTVNSNLQGDGACQENQKRVECLYISPNTKLIQQEIL